MEGKYTKIGAVVGIIALLITVWKINSDRTSTLAGEWIMTSEIQDAKLSSYKGMEIEWALHLSQNKQEIEGIGEKTKVNGNNLAFSKRTNIKLKGSITGNHFIFHYVENGTLRQTGGVFEGTISGNTFHGNFTSTASDSKGIINGTRK